MLPLLFSLVLPLGGAPTPLTCGPDSAPAPATAIGYTCEVFWDHFLTQNSIDVGNSTLPFGCPVATDNSYGNTKGASCNWFINDFWTIPGSSTPPFSGAYQKGTVTISSDWSIAGGGGLVLAPITNAGVMFNSCVYSSSGAGYSGAAISGGYYLEITFTHSGTLSGGAPAAVWSVPEEYLTSGPSGNLNWVETDFYESSFGQNMHWWKQTNGSPSELASQSFGIAPVGTLGWASIPGSPNTVEWFRSSAIQNSFTMTYGTALVPVVGGVTTGNPSGSFAELPASHQCLILSGGYGEAITITSIKIWQASP